MWIDTHCHLDAEEFDNDRSAVVDDALAAGVSSIWVPAVDLNSCKAVAKLRAHFSICRPAFGLHPHRVAQHRSEHLEKLVDLIQQTRPIALGEIGLDLFLPGLDFERQILFFVAQLKIAQRFRLPVLLHVRRAQDQVLKYLRRYSVCGGIAHAFNGSEQQAKAFLALGFKLGFGGALSYTRALRIRALARTLPLDALVLETDAPDIPPSWAVRQRNTPDQIPRLGAILAALRGEPVEHLAAATRQNAESLLTSL